MLNDDTLEKWKVALDTVEGEDNPIELARFLANNPDLTFTSDFGGPRVTLTLAAWTAAGMRPSWPRPYVHTAGTINVDVVAELVRLNQKAATLTKMLATAREPAELVTISGNIRDPEKRIMAISMVRAVAGLMLGEARDLCEGTPTKVRVDRADILRMSAFVSHCALDITTHE